MVTKIKIGPEGPEVSVKSGAKVVRQLRGQVRTYERRYEVSSDTMRKAVVEGKVKETAEISRWLQKDLVLRRLTDMGGTLTRITSRSTKRG